MTLRGARLLLKKMMQRAIDDLKCDGVMGFTRLDGDWPDVNCDLTFISEQLPTVDKVVAGILPEGGNRDNYRPYQPGMSAKVGETIYYKITVTQYKYKDSEKYKEQDPLKYNKITLTDTMKDEAGKPLDVKLYKDKNGDLQKPALRNPYGGVHNEFASDSRTLTENKVITYYASHKVTEADLEQKLTNTVVLDTQYTSTYSNGDYVRNAEAVAEIMATAFQAPDVVVDFGLPVTVSIDEFGKDVQLTGGSATYGAVAVEATKTGWNVTYTPTEILRGVDTVTLSSQSGKTYSFKVYPATTVYYEEGFATPVKGFTGGTKGTGTQQTQYVGKQDSYNNFGYDAKYAAETGMSNGTEAVSNAIADSAEFGFTGTGFEVFANCSPKTGIAVVILKDTKTNKVVKLYQVHTIVKKGDTVATNPNVSEGEEVSLPIVSVQDLPYSDYTVTVTHAKASANAAPDQVKLDGYRIFGTLDNDKNAQDRAAAYPADEQNPHFVELRDMVLTGLSVNQDTDSSAAIDQVFENTGNLKGALVIADGVQYTPEHTQDLVKNGPKNELFLYPGQAVTFNLANGVNAQIGMKAPNGAVKYTINRENRTITSSTDMFCHKNVSGEVTIANNSANGAILSITLIKYFGNAAPAQIFADVTPMQVQDAMVALGVQAETPVEPEPQKADAVLTLELVNHAGKKLAAATLTENGVVGEQATFTAEAVRAAVDAQMPAGYALANTNAISDELVNYGEQNTVQLKVGQTATLKVSYVKRTYQRSGWLGLVIKPVDKVVGTAELTAVQVNAGKTHTFRGKEIRNAAPAGYSVSGLVRSQKVSFGKTASVTQRVH